VNLPNRITVLRILLVPPILLFMLPLPACAVFQSWNSFVVQYGNFVALALFALAALTDLIDGRVARKMKLVTNFGKFLDPIADKLLVISVLIALAQQGRLRALPIIIIIIREFIVTGIRLTASDKGVVIAASNLGKAKTVSQIVAILIILSEKIWVTIFSPTAASYQAPININPVLITTAGDLAMFAAVMLTLISGIDYVWKNRSLLKE
jgi:CDP-diacylglycerol---glycerol-3-phosphate 3-phosphatidyltransferase